MRIRALTFQNFCAFCQSPYAVHAARYQFSKLISIVTFFCAYIEHIHLGAVLTFENLSLKAPTEFSVATHQMMQQLSVMSAFFFLFCNILQASPRIE